MKTQAEHLPNELWLSIFSYLEAHDLFYGFLNLNHRFNRLLASGYLRFYLILDKRNGYDDQYDVTSRWLDRILKRIICLRLTAQRGYEDISKYLSDNAYKLFRLQSLTVTINKYQTCNICRILRRLHSLKYLSITCRKTSFLIKTILGLPTLRVLHLTFEKSTWYDIYSFKANNSIEIFYIKFQALSDNELTNFLLSKMPNLKRFQLSANEYNYFNQEKLFARPILNFSKLRTIKLVGGVEYLCSIDLNHLQTIMSSLQTLHIDIYCFCIGEDLFDHLFYYWWPILEKLGNIYVRIEGFAEGDFATEMDNYWKMLLRKNNESNNCFRIEWESDLLLSLIKVTIIKNKKRIIV